MKRQDAIEATLSLCRIGLEREIEAINDFEEMEPGEQAFHLSTTMLHYVVSVMREVKIPPENVLGILIQILVNESFGVVLTNEAADKIAASMRPALKAALNIQSDDSKQVLN